MEKDILLVHQHHDADRAGKHIDWRIVVGDKAFSWATKKPVPPSGGKLILWEQPVHDAEYATKKKIVIPKGQYGAGTTELKYAQRGKAKFEHDKYYELNLNNGDRFYIKKMPSYGDKAWLLVNLTGMKKKEDMKKTAGSTFNTLNNSSTQDEIYPQAKMRPTNADKRDVVEEGEDESKSIIARLKVFVNSIKKPDPSGKRQEVEKVAYVQPMPIETSTKKPKKPTPAEDQKRMDTMDQSYTGQAHQNRVVEKLKQRHPRLLAYHGLGSGKTLTGLMAAQNAQKEGKNVTFITPAGLTKNVEKEQKKHKIRLQKKPRVLSYEMAVKKKQELLKGNDMIIMDEAHKLRNQDSARFRELDPVLQKADNLLMLSGSPIYNEPKNLSTLINTLARDNVLPEKTEDFEKQFINKKKIDPGIFRRLFLGVKPSTRSELKNQGMLKNVLDQYIDYYEPDEQGKAFYPKVNENEVKVPMSREQQKIYDFLEGSLPGHVKWMIRMGLPPDKKSSKDLNAFASGLRQVSNSAGPFTRHKENAGPSPKIERAASNLIKRYQTDKNFRGIVYSNYLKAGIEPYAAALDTLGIKYEIITGELPMKKRLQVVKDYNEGKNKVILLSSAGGEGLDLKGTKLVQVLEPHWNKEKINQVVGRGVRYKSHEHLPPEERTVEVEHYLSTVKQTAVDKLFRVNPKSMDEYLRDRSTDKDQFNEQVKGLLRKQPKDMQ